MDKPRNSPRQEDEVNFHELGYRDGKTTGLFLGFFLGAAAMALVFLLFVR